MNSRHALKTAALLALVFASGGAQADVAREDIIFLAEDGKHYTTYKTLRSDLEKRSVALAPGEDADDLLYFSPAEHAEIIKGDSTLLSFNGGSYALIRAGQFNGQELEKESANVFHFRSWNGEKLSNGHFGKWNAPGAFAQFSYVWVLPQNIEILEYDANQRGEWTRRDNTLAWSGKNVNDLAFEIRYRVQDTSKAPLALDFSGLENAENNVGLTRITLESGSLFPSGSHRFTAQGKKLLSELAAKLGERDAAGIIVEGHTDNQQLKPYLRKTYPSNWELSAARATIVVRWLAENGVKPEILEARAYGEQRPQASNNNAEGRAKNRRIEILVRDKKIDSNGVMSDNSRKDAPTDAATEPTPQSEPAAELTPEPAPESVPDPSITTSKPASAEKEAAPAPVDSGNQSQPEEQAETEKPEDAAANSGFTRNP